MLKLGPVRPAANGFMTWALICVALILTGCASDRVVLQVNVQPSDANVKAAKLPGEENVSVRRSGSSWLVPVSFANSGIRYRVTTSRKGFATQTHVISSTDFLNLPRVDGNNDQRKLAVTLTRERLLRFESNAPGATFVLTSPAGKTFELRAGEAVAFAPRLGLQPYELVVEAPGYESHTITLTPREINEAIDHAGGLMRVAISSNSFTLTRQVLAVVEPGQGLVARERQLRAWFNDRSAAQRTEVIAELQGDLKVRGVTVDPAARRLVYAFLGGQNVLSDGAQIKEADLHQVSLTPGNRDAMALPKTGFVNIDPYIANDPSQTLLFASNSQSRLNTFDLLAVTRDAPGRTRVLRQGTSEYGWLAPSMSVGLQLAAIQMPIQHAEPPSMYLFSSLRTRPGPPQRMAEHARQAKISPDGRKIAYIDSSSGDLFIFEIVSGSVRRLTKNGAAVQQGVKQVVRSPSDQCSQPYSDIAWSPDSRHLVYSSAEGRDASGIHNYDIWIAPACGGSPRQITTDGSADLMPVWSSDNYLYFISNRGGRWALHRIDSPVPLQSVR